MKTVLSFIIVCSFSFSAATAQTSKKQGQPKASEQQEISATKRVEKELQRKQLSGKPTLLQEQVNEEEMKKKASIKVGKKRKDAKSKDLDKG